MTDVFIPQDIDYPALRLDIDRTRAAQLGLDQREVVGNVITALTSNQMIAPSYWIDPKNGNDYMLTVQYPGEPGAKPAAICARFRCAARQRVEPTRLDAITQHRPHQRADRGRPLPAAPHHRHLRAPARAKISARIADAIDGIIADTKVPDGLTVDAARHGAGHARVVHELRPRPAAWPWCCCT